MVWLVGIAMADGLVCLLIMLRVLHIHPDGIQQLNVSKRFFINAPCHSTYLDAFYTKFTFA